MACRCAWNCSGVQVLPQGLSALLGRPCHGCITIRIAAAGLFSGWLQPACSLPACLPRLTRWPAPPPPAQDVLDVPCNGTGRYLSIQRLTRQSNSDSWALILVEVQVGGGHCVRLQAQP